VWEWNAVFVGQNPGGGERAKNGGTGEVNAKNRSRGITSGKIGRGKKWSPGDNQGLGQVERKIET